MAFTQTTGGFQGDDNMKKLMDIQKATAKAMPSDKPYSPEPFKITENVYLDDLNDDFEDLDMDVGPEVPEDPTGTLDDPALYELDLSLDDEVNSLMDDTEELDLSLEEEQNEIEDPDAIWEPKSYQSYVKEQMEKEPEIDWLGAKENSFIKHGWEYLKQQIDDDYVPMNSIEGRELVLVEVNKLLEEQGPVKLTDYAGIRKAKDLWNERYKLQFQNEMDKAMIESDLPGPKEFMEAVSENPEKFFKNIAQEILNKPELLFVPQIAAARGAAVGVLAAKSVGVGAKATQVAKLTGTLAGAYTGGVSLGTLDRIATQSTKTGEVNAAKALEQAQVDGILGMVLVGGGMALTRGVNKASAYNASKKTAREFAKDSVKQTEKDLDVLRTANKVQEAIDDPATETYIDGNGNVYNFEIRETIDTQTMKADLDNIAEFQKKYVDDPQALEALDLEKTRLQKDYDIAIAKGMDVTDIEAKMKSLSDEGGNLSLAEDVAYKWRLSKERRPAVTTNFMSFTDVDGNRHRLRRLTPEVLKETPIRIEGIAPMDLTGTMDVAKARSKFFHSLSDFAVSATSALQPIAQTSKAAKMLIDLVDPLSGKGGRSPLYSIQENIDFKQGEYMVKSNDLANLLRKELGDTGELELRQHMRGLIQSENPVVLQVAQGYRELLDGARDYAMSKGMQVDKAPDFLPRYYDQKKLETPEAQQALALKISELSKGKYDYDSTLESAVSIANNLGKESDEAGRYIKDGKVMPIGFRKWKEIPDSELDEFLNENFIASLDRYLMNNAKRTEVDYVFGYNGKKLKEDWLPTIEKEARDSGRFLEQRERDSILDLYDLINGTYGGPMSGTGKQVVDGLLAAQNAMKLPLVTITSALEPLSMMFRLNESAGVRDLVNAYGGKQVRKLFGKTDGTGSKYDDMTIADINREAKEVGLIHEVAVKERIEAITGEGLEGLPARINNKVMKGFLLHQWTEHNRAIAYEASRLDLLKSIKGLSRDPSGPKATLRKRWLAEANVDPDLAVKWLQEGGDINSPTYVSIKRGAARLTNTIIANPDKINKAKILSSNQAIWRLTGQFKSFGSTFNNTVVKSTIDESVKLWNGGHRMKALGKVGKVFGVISAMTYWTTYKTPLIFGEGVTGEDKPEDVALKVTQGMAGMLIPGASLFAPVVGGRGLTPVLGPTLSDANTILQGNNPANVVPTYKKVVEKITEE